VLPGQGNNRNDNKTGDLGHVLGYEHGEGQSSNQRSGKANDLGDIGDERRRHELGRLEKSILLFETLLALGTATSEVIPRLSLASYTKLQLYVDQSYR
jgi:hypothetical protein